LYATGFIVFKYFKHSVSGFYYQRKFLIIPAGECFLTIGKEDSIDKIFSSFSTGPNADKCSHQRHSARKQDPETVAKN
jgi:hypothetical protein